MSLFALRQPQDIRRTKNYIYGTNLAIVFAFLSSLHSSCLVAELFHTGKKMPTTPWTEIHKAKKAQQLSRIPPEWRLSSDFLSSHKDTVDLRPLAASCGVLSSRELEITDRKYDATGLAEQIALGTYSAVEVVTAFCKRAAVAQQLCNCLTEIMFLDAIEGAKKLDEEYKKTGKTVGPLHGVPMTFKVRRRCC